MNLSDLRLLLEDDRRRGLVATRRYHIQQYLQLRANRNR